MRKRADRPLRRFGRGYGFAHLRRGRDAHFAEQLAAAGLVDRERALRRDRALRSARGWG